LICQLLFLSSFSDPYFQLAPLPPANPRRQGADRFAYIHPSSSLNALPENDAYTPQNRYDHSFIPHPNARPPAGPGIRIDEHVSPPGQWYVPSPLLAPVHAEPYYPSMTGRMMTSSAMHEQPRHRYQ
jgi:hypothetical protein